MDWLTADETSKTDGQTEIQTDRNTGRQKYRQTEIQTHRRTDGQIDIRTERHTDRRTVGQTNRETDRWRNLHAGIWPLKKGRGGRYPPPPPNLRWLKGRRRQAMTSYVIFLLEFPSFPALSIYCNTWRVERSRDFYTCMRTCSRHSICTFCTLQ